MGYLPRNLLHKAYLTLSSLTEDHKQGQTQLTSALRHLLALDMFYKEQGEDCDLNYAENRDAFTENVKEIVNVTGNYYTTNFYTNIKELEDCGVGSNFYSAGVVNNSKQNTAYTYDYPTRGQYPLFKVRSNTLIREITYFKNINGYLRNQDLKCAFLIWVLRNHWVNVLEASSIKKQMLSLFTEELVDSIMPKEERLNEYVMGYNLENDRIELTVSELLGLFSTKKEILEAIMDLKYQPYITAIRTKPFLLLAGISGTGKSRIVRELAFKSCPKFLQDIEGTTPGNYCMIEVKPNWHDSTELLGYYSRLGQAGYQFKKFVMFLVKAKMFPKVPFFVCLDEMNLAPVEHYFAEILSILETRKHPKIAGTDEVDMEVIKTDTIVEARYFRELGQMNTTKNISTGQAFSMNLTDRDIYMKLFGIETENDIDEEVGKKTDLTTIGLTLPDNVIIIGTVNMDDTTHQFSRKVIDRAMTIEMNGGKLSDMYGGSKDLEYLAGAEQEKWQKAFVQRYVTADEVLKVHSEVADDIIKKVPVRLEEINKALKGTPFEVSYRVLNELTIMIGVMLDDPEEDGDIDSIIDKALDRILLMKILPRIEGDADMFNLSSEFKKKNDITYDNRLEWLKELAPNIVISEDEPHQQTAREKIQEMIERLGNQEFTRFWP